MARITIGKVVGDAAGFGTPSAVAETLAAGSQATASVTASGEDTEKIFSFEFGIPAGATGPQGIQGIQGETGATGPQGETGPQGAKGDAATIQVGTVTTGEPGTNVSVTNSGTQYAAVFDFSIPKGPKGDKGDTGNTGPQGETGAAGSAATIAVGSVTTGEPGTDASVSNIGTSSAAVFNFTIPRGEKGAKGDKGDTGAAGSSGSAATIQVGTVTTGEAGSQVSIVNSGTEYAAILDFTIPRGSKGDIGAQGPQGPRGPEGPQGPMGPTGATGATGATGPQGETGPQGPQGEQGIQGIQGIQGETGPQGEQGIQGEKGDTGDAATIQVGTVTTLDAASSATVVNSGTSGAAVFDFGIPRGAVPTISVGTVTSGSSAAVVNSGTSTAAVFDFTLPKGDKGDTGNTGAAAGFDTPTISVSTLQAGASATASVAASGPDTAKVFDFTFGIPKGDKGDKGDTGNTGTAAGFGVPTISVSTLQAGASATATVAASGPDTAKVFDFNFGIPKGDKGDKGDTGNAGSAATIAVGTVTSGSSAAVVNSGTSSAAVFDFTLPKGDKGDTGNTGNAAGFGTPSASVTMISAASSATASIATSGPDTAKVFDFSFGIPRSFRTSTVTIAVNDWSSGSATKSVSGITSSSVLIATPQSGSMTSAVNSGVYCSAQGTNSLTFTAAISTPSSAITFDVIELL